MRKKYMYIAVLVLMSAICMAGCDWDEEANNAEVTVTEISDEGDEIEAVEEILDSVDKNEIAEEGIENAETESMGNDYPVGVGANISFDTVDVYGEPFNEDMLKESRVILLNLWEPWCGPCVNEMPDLNYLYETYKDEGLLIIGAYSTFEMDEDAKELVEEFGITYPIVKCNESIYGLEQDFVPASYLLDRNGNLITEHPFVGANSYEGWEAVIKEYVE